MATVTLQYLDVVRTISHVVKSSLTHAWQQYGSGNLVLFEVTATQVWRGFEILPWLFLGVCGGLYGHFFIRLNVHFARFRSTTRLSQYPVVEVIGVAFVTALISYMIPFAREPTSQLVEAMFTDCGDFDFYGLCESVSPPAYQ